MTVNPNTVKQALRDGGDEYHYRDENCDIGGDRIHESTVKVSHFVVKRDARDNGIASTLLDCLETVLREDGVTTLEIEMGATDYYSLEELDAKRDEIVESDERNKHNDPDWHDTTYDFLKNKGFQRLDYIETYQWGLCVTGHKYV